MEALPDRLCDRQCTIAALSRLPNPRSGAVKSTALVCGIIGRGCRHCAFQICPAPKSVLASACDQPQAGVQHGAGRSTNRSQVRPSSFQNLTYPGQSQSATMLHARMTPPLPPRSGLVRRRRRAECQVRGCAQRTAPTTASVAAHPSQSHSTIPLCR